MISLAAAIALLAVLAGVLLAVLDQPEADADRRTERLSLVLVVAVSVIAATGGAYTLIV
jgi:uncharacterized membrane protein